MTVRDQYSKLGDRVLDASLGRPRLVLGLCFLVIIGFGFGLKGVVKDPSVDAFVPLHHSAAIARKMAVETFGVEDPIIIALTAEIGQSAFTPVSLEALRKIESRVRVLDNVDKSGLISVLSESAIAGDNGDLVVDPLLDSGPVTPATAAAAFDRLVTMPMMVGLLASRNGDTITMIVPVHDSNAAGQTYRDVLAIVNEEAPSGYGAHVTGVASMNGRLAQIVDHDTKIFIPTAIFTALLILFVAMRRVSALLGPLLVIAGSAAIAIGLMGWLDARYYLITTALPVIIMGIAIADSLHISIFYLRERERHHDLSPREAIKRALNHTFLPVTLTSITTVAGFAGLAIGSPMLPISQFGWFAAIGVIAAWALSLTLLPSIILLTKLTPKRTKSLVSTAKLDQWVAQITHRSFAYPTLYGGTTLLVLIALGIIASGARFDYERQRYFQANDPVRISDVTLNTRLDGLNFLDVIVSSDQADGLMTPQAIAAIAELKVDLKSVPLVSKVTAIDDYMSLMHSVLTGAQQGQLPTQPNAPAQYMFLYEASGDPGDFKEEIDYNYQHALIRGQLTTDRYSTTRPTVAAFEQITKDWSAKHGLSTQISGRVAVNAGWMDLLAASHFKSLGIAVALVFLTSAIAFRGIWPALLTLVPVLTGVVFTYAAMRLFNVDIAPATSMTAAIATGLGVDFAIHLLAEVRKAEQQGARGVSVFKGRYSLVARACIYSALALAIALAVICLSSAPPLRWFGALVAAAALGSLAGAILVMPALFALANKKLSVATVKLEPQS